MTVDDLLLPLNDPRVLYDLRGDPDKRAAIRRHSLSASLAKLRMDHDIVGSPEWWHSVAVGSVSLGSSAATISGLDYGPYGDYPSLTLDVGGRTETLELWRGFTRDLIGRKIIVCYAWVETTLESLPMVKTTIQVRAEGTTGGRAAQSGWQGPDQPPAVGR